MNKDRRLALLEQIGSQLCEIGGNVDYLEVVFLDAGSDELGRLGLDRAIHSLAGDVYIFEDLDLREAVSARVEVI